MAHSETATLTEAIKVLQELENELEEVSKEIASTKRRLLTLTEDETAKLKAQLLERTDTVAEAMVKVAAEEAAVREKQIWSQVEKDLNQLKKRIEAVRPKAVSLVIDALTAS